MAAQSRGSTTLEIDLSMQQVLLVTDARARIHSEVASSHRMEWMVLEQNVCTYHCAWAPFLWRKKVTSRSMIRVAKKGSLSSSHSTLSSPASGNLGTGQSHEASEQRRRRHNPAKRKDEGKSSDSNNSMNISARAGEKGKPTTNV